MKEGPADLYFTSCYCKCIRNNKQTTIATSTHDACELRRSMTMTDSCLLKVQPNDRFARTLLMRELLLVTMQCGKVNTTLIETDESIFASSVPSSLLLILFIPRPATELK